MERSQTQVAIDVMFEVLSRVHARDRVPEDRDELMEWARRQLCSSGIDVVPRGTSHAVLLKQGKVY